MAGYFRDYADLCFEAFGDRVKHWLTFSDPRVSRGTSSDGEMGMSSAVCHDPESPLLSLQTMVEKGYETGLHAPGLRLQGTGLYIAAHHIIKVSQAPLGRRLASRRGHCIRGHTGPLPHQYVPWALGLRICSLHHHSGTAKVLHWPILLILPKGRGRHLETCHVYI